MRRIGIVGAGKWGQALHFALSRENEVLITSRTPRDIEGFSTLDEVLTCKDIVIAIPAQQIASWLKAHFKYSGQNILVAAKGIEASTGRFLNEIYSDYVPKERIAFLSGPSFAAEVMQSLPTLVVINSHSQTLAERFAGFFPDFMRTYISQDVIGAEVAGAYKNVIAIASGITEGLALGNNARAALMARGLVEMLRFGKEFGAKDESFIGLSGAGDLFLTASSTLSRNYRMGLGLAEGKSKEEVLEALGEVAEGVGTTYALHKIAEERGIYLPIATEVYAILEGKAPEASLRDLLTR